MSKLHVLTTTYRWLLLLRQIANTLQTVTSAQQVPPPPHLNLLKLEISAVTFNALLWMPSIQMTSYNLQLSCKKWNERPRQWSNMVCLKLSIKFSDSAATTFRMHSAQKMSDIHCQTISSLSSCHTEVNTQKCSITFCILQIGLDWARFNVQLDTF